MNYRVIVLPSALREIKKLSKDIHQRILTHITELEGEPRPSGAIKMQGRDAYRIRVGDYRILYTIEDTIRIVTVIRVGHRREVYR